MSFFSRFFQKDPTVATAKPAETDPAVKKKKNIKSAVEFMSGKDNKKPEIKKPAPGFFRYLLANWKSQETDAPDGLRRAGYLYKKYQQEKSSEESHLQIYEIISQAAAFNSEFMVLLFGSALIATFGLLQGSSAVIIGAMIIAPLMMPILGFALGSIWGDQKLILRSLLTLLGGALAAIFFSTLISLLAPVYEYNNEIMARINPNLYDILVALASGFVGAYAYINPNILSSISGVAIAVALMPPLCTVGITLGNGDYTAALGALLLFVINMVAISLTASLVFWKFRLHPVQSSDEEVGARARKKVFLAAGILLLIAVPLTWFMINTYRQNQEKNAALQWLQALSPQIEIITYSMTSSHNQNTLRLVFVSAGMSAETLAYIQKTLPQKFSRPTELKLFALQSIGAPPASAQEPKEP